MTITPHTRPGWLRPRTAALYADVSARTVAAWLKSGLPSVKVGGVVLIQREALDKWLSGFSVDQGPGVDQLVSEVMDGL